MNRLAYNLDYVMPREGEMAQRQLAEIAADATALRAALHPDDNLPAWTQYKISTAQDRLHAASGYLRYKIARMNEQNVNVNLGAIDEYLSEYGNPTEGKGKKDKKAKVEVPFRDQVKPYVPWIALSGGLVAVLYFGFRKDPPKGKKKK